MIICGYSHTSPRDHPLNCQGHSYTEGSDKVGMHPTHLGLVETGIGYTESIWVVKGDKEKYCTAIRKYHNLFLQPDFRTAAVDTWGGLHFLPLITTIFLSWYEKDSFLLQLDSGVSGFNRCKGTILYDGQADEMSVASTNPYQVYVVAPIMKGGFKYIGMGLIYKPAIVRPGNIAKCKMFLDFFFSSCGDLPDVEAQEIYLQSKCRGVSPLSCPLPTWACLDFVTPNPGVRNPQISPSTPVYHSSSLTFQLMTASEHYLIGT